MSHHQRKIKNVTISDIIIHPGEISLVIPHQVRSSNIMICGHELMYLHHLSLLFTCHHLCLEQFY